MTLRTPRLLKAAFALVCALVCAPTSLVVVVVNAQVQPVELTIFFGGRRRGIMIPVRVFPNPTPDPDPNPTPALTLKLRPEPKPKPKPKP